MQLEYGVKYLKYLLSIELGILKIDSDNVETRLIRIARYYLTPKSAMC